MNFVHLINWRKKVWQSSWFHPRPNLKYQNMVLLHFVEKHAGYRNKGTPKVDKAHLIELVTLFFACFRGRALLESNSATNVQSETFDVREVMARFAFQYIGRTSDTARETWKFV